MIVKYHYVTKNLSSYIAIREVSILDFHLSSRIIEKTTSCRSDSVPMENPHFQTRKATKADVPSIAKMIKVWFASLYIICFDYISFMKILPCTWPQYPNFVFNNVIRESSLFVKNGYRINFASLIFLFKMWQNWTLAFKDILGDTNKIFDCGNSFTNPYNYLSLMPSWNKRDYTNSYNLVVHF